MQRQERQDQRDSLMHARAERQVDVPYTNTNKQRARDIHPRKERYIKSTSTDKQVRYKYEETEDHRQGQANLICD